MKEKIREFLPVLLVALLLVVSFGSVQEVKATNIKPSFIVKTTKSVVKPGDEFQVEIWVGENQDIISFVGNLKYDVDLFEMVGKKGIQGPVSDVAQNPVFLIDPGSISILMSFEEAYDVGGLVYTIKLKVKEDAYGTGNIGWDFCGAEMGQDLDDLEVVDSGNKNANISVTDKNGNLIKNGDIKINIPLKSIELDKNTPTEMFKGQNHKLIVQLFPENTTEDVEILYSSSNEEIVSVNVDGRVQALKEGKAVIKVATVEGRYEVSYTLTVRGIPLEAIVFKEQITPLKEGQQAQLEVLLNPNNTTDDRTVIWSSSDEEVATVENGLLKALKPGVTEITAKVGEEDISYELTVVEKKSESGSGNNGNADSNNLQESGKVNNIERKDVEKTGDTSNVLFATLIILLSLFVMTDVVLIKKRRKKRD